MENSTLPKNNFLVKIFPLLILLIILPLSFFLGVKSNMQSHFQSYAQAASSPTPTPLYKFICGVYGSCFQINSSACLKGVTCYDNQSTCESACTQSGGGDGEPTSTPTPVPQIKYGCGYVNGICFLTDQEYCDIHTGIRCYDSSNECSSNCPFRPSATPIIPTETPPTTPIMPPLFCQADFNRNGDIDAADLNLLIQEAGKDCRFMPPTPTPPTCGDEVCDVNLGETPENCQTDCAPVASCPEDLNVDGQVNNADLSILASQWGICPEGEGTISICSADLNQDGQVDENDLDILREAWGTCPAEATSSASVQSQ